MAASATRTSFATAPSLYPNPSEAALKIQFVGKDLNDVQAPAAVLDVAVIRQNCKLMLDATSQLGVEFRAHVKTHKTAEITKLQVGENSQSVKLVCSTVSEIENLVPWLLECKAQGKEINVLYGLPVVYSAISRLGAIARVLGQGSIGVFIDHAEQVKELTRVKDEIWPGEIPAWINIDVGYHREGVATGSVQLSEIADAMHDSHNNVRNDPKTIRLEGMYTHHGTSYSSSSPEEALQFLSAELEGLRKGAESFLGQNRSYARSRRGKVTLSVGATPTATSTQNLLADTAGAKQYREMLENIKESFTVEIHAGVYPVMDMQQLATRARPEQSTIDPTQNLLSYSQLGLRMLVEVASVYDDREKPEALIAAGSIALGREPCKSYDGWGVVTPWPESQGHHYDPAGSKTGWIVGRIAQEHGMLTWEGPRENMTELCYGEKLMLWPNHACIAAVNYGWYLVVDSDKEDPNIVQDVWLRWRGW